MSVAGCFSRLFAAEVDGVVESNVNVVVLVDELLVAEPDCVNTCELLEIVGNFC